jgi:hypothetical protein
VLFRHYGYAPEVPRARPGGAAQTWALILDRLGGYLASGSPQPFFPAATA